MKAIVCERIERFAIIELNEPSAPKTGEAVVRIRRIGVCGTDLHAYRGNQPFFTYPRILGHELAGTVEAVGEQVSGLREGDQVSVIPYMACGHCIACRNGKTNCCTDMQVLGVHIDGGMRERMTLPADHLIRTEGLTLDQSAILEPLSIGAHAVRRSELREGENVLVIGGGPIGLGVMALAKRKGARVIAMDVNDDRLAFCKEWAKVDETVNARQEAALRLAELTNGEFPTVVFDATGSVHSMNDSFGMAAHGGKLVFVGLVKADITFHDPEFHKRELTLLSSRNATITDFEEVMAAVRDGSIDAARYITHRTAFAEMIRQFEGWMQPGAGVIKAMVEL